MRSKEHGMLQSNQHQACKLIGGELLKEQDWLLTVKADRLLAEHLDRELGSV